MIMPRGIISRNSSFAHRGRAVDVRQIAREQSVRYVVEGSIRKRGNRIRITAPLTDAGSGAHIWADRYDRNLTDVFEIQDEITDNIATPWLPSSPRQKYLARSTSIRATSMRGMRIRERCR